MTLRRMNTKRKNLTPGLFAAIPISECADTMKGIVLQHAVMDNATPGRGNHQSKGPH